MMKILLLFVLLAFALEAYARAERTKPLTVTTEADACLDEATVRRHYPDKRVMWTTHAAGHDGEKCFRPGEKKTLACIPVAELTRLRRLAATPRPAARSAVLNNISEQHMLWQMYNDWLARQRQREIKP